MALDQLDAGQGPTVTVARLDATLALVRLLAEGTETDPALRLADLQTRRAELDVEIARVRAGEVRPLSAAEARDLRALVEHTAAGLRDAPAVAEALLSPGRRDAVAAQLARVGMAGAHHAWLAAEPAEPAGALSPGSDEELPWDGVDDSPELGDDPGPVESGPEPLTDHVRQALRHRPDRPLADLLADRPLQGGLAELVAWLALADDAVDTHLDDGTDQVGWTDPTGTSRVATLPHVVFHRATTPTRETPR